MSFFSGDSNYYIRSTAVALKFLFAVVLLVSSLYILLNAHSFLKVPEDDTDTSSAPFVVAMNDFRYTIVRARQLFSLYDVNKEKFIMDRDSQLEAQIVNITSKLEKSIGIMAVVQFMMLEKNLDSDDSESNCLEWIKFSSEDDSFHTDETCGTGMAAIKATHVPGMSYITYSDALVVKYNLPVDRKPVSDVLKTKALIKFTNVYECPTDTKNDEKQTLRTCKVGNIHSCIPAELFCDGVVDCSDFGDGIGFDESNCPHLDIIDSARGNENQLIFTGEITNDSPSFKNIFYWFGLNDGLQDGLSKTYVTIFIALPAFLIMFISFYCILEIIIWGPGTDNEKDNMKQTIKNIRKIRAISQLHGSGESKTTRIESSISWIPSLETEDNDLEDDECHYLPWSFPPCHCVCDESGQILPIYTREFETFPTEEEKNEKQEA